MKRVRAHDIRIATEAAQWQDALARNDPTARTEFAAWVKASPRHLHEFLLMEAIDAAAKRIDPQFNIQFGPDVAEAQEDVASLPTNAPDSRWFTRSRRGNGEGIGRSSPVPMWQWATAALTLVACVLGMLFWFAPGLLDGWDRYATAVGEQRTVELPDGSVLQLNARSSVQVRFTKHVRNIRLIDGEALFKVAHDAGRPFIVASNDLLVRAVGTEFDVYQHPGRTAVTVLEGKVQIQPIAAEELSATPPRNRKSPAEGAKPTIPIRSAAKITYLAAGQAASVEGDGKILRHIDVDVSDATAWRQRRLVFREETLAVIAEEFNRYNQHIQFEVDGATTGARRYGGTFDADDPDSLALFLSRDQGMDVERQGTRIVLRAR